MAAIGNRRDRSRKWRNMEELMAKCGMPENRRTPQNAIEKTAGHPQRIT